MTEIYYVAATNRMTWGKSESKWQAIGIAIQHAGVPCSNIQLFEVKCPDKTIPSEIYVDQMGQIHAPKGSEFNRIADIKSTDMSKKFLDFYMSVQEY